MVSSIPHKSSSTRSYRDIAIRTPLSEAEKQRLHEELHRMIQYAIDNNSETMYAYALRQSMIQSQPMADITSTMITDQPSAIVTTAAVPTTARRVGMGKAVEGNREVAEEIAEDTEQMDYSASLDA